MELKMPKVHATLTKTVVLAFFDSRSMTFKNFVPKGKTVNGKYIVKYLLIL
jgi:hypothetical protein